MLTDLDLGMNDHMSEPFEWDEARSLKRGKVYDAKQLDNIENFGRYLDVDNDGITYRTYPGTHKSKGSFFTRGTSRDEYATYSEDSASYVRNMKRLLKKWNTAKKMVPAPQLYQKKNEYPLGALFFGTTRFSAEEAISDLAAEGISLDAIRIKAFPFNKTVEEFVNSHDKIFVIEQNRDAQMRSLLVNELNINPAKLIPVLNYDGMPITADFIKGEIEENLANTNQISQIKMKGII
jgi:2-oxoglutarate ferredoxin oxidoreductase subunit alpha